jgi:hypothetical protein
MPNVLTKLRIDEISAVDRGAGEGARITLWKRDSATKKATDMADRFLEVCKRVADGDVSVIVPSEAEMFEHIQKYVTAEHRRPGESQPAAFARVFGGQDAEGETLRRAVNVCKRHAGFPL